MSTASQTPQTGSKHRLGARRATPFVTVVPRPIDDATSAKRPTTKSRLATKLSRASSASSGDSLKTFAERHVVRDAARDDTAREAEQTPAPAQLTTTAMRGQGFYNRHSQMQREAGSLGLDTFARAVDALPLPVITNERGIRIVDFGSSQGLNSMLPMRLAVNILASRTASIEVIHQDLPTNDFASLFHVVNTHPESYNKPASSPSSHVFTLARPGDFHDRLFPVESIHLAWTSIASHWLSTPCPLQTVLHHNDLPPDHILRESDPREYQRLLDLRDIARREWLDFCLHREAELAPGGQLVHVGLVSVPVGEAVTRINAHANVHANDINDDDDDALAWSSWTPARRAAMDALRRAVGAEALRGTCLPVYFRTVEEYLEPFSGTTPASRLLVRECFVARTRDLFMEEYRRTRDASAFADSIIGALDAAVTPALRLERFDAERVASFYADLRSTLEAKPELFGSGMTVVVMRLEKPSSL